MSDEARRVAAGAAALRASSDVDRKPAAAGSPPPGAAAAGGHKIQLKSADMKEEMRLEAFDIARVAFEKHTMEKDIAEYIKKEFDKNHGPTWHCIVGRNFGNCSRLLLPAGNLQLLVQASCGGSCLPV
uniref:Dynein light chain n=1 Tax=Leersia perrieri TaxID=77586 RepID=A0A0D9UZ74_9ORYZ